MNKIKIKNKKILIIGGAGFIGHNLALKLKEYQADVIIIDGLTVNNLYAIQQNKLQLPYPKLASTILNERQKLLKKAGIPLYIEDARDYHKLSSLFNKLKPQIIIHLRLCRTQINQIKILILLLIIV